MLSKGSMFSAKRETTSQPQANRPGATTTTAAPSSAETPAGLQATLSGKDVVAASAGSVLTRNPPAASGQAKQGATLVVGPGVKLKGAEIQDCDTLVVEGRVEATMDSRFIQVADQGSFDGKVNIDVAEIHGRFSGELTAREQIVVYATGQVSGKIRYGRIVVHEGGEISGDVRSLSGESAGGRGIVSDSSSSNSSAEPDKLLSIRTA